MESECEWTDKKRRELSSRCSSCWPTRRRVWLYMHPRLVVTKKGVTGIWKDLADPSLDSPRSAGRSKKSGCAGTSWRRVAAMVVTSSSFLLVFVVVRSSG